MVYSWRLKQHVPPKRWKMCTRLHCVTSQKIVIFVHFVDCHVHKNVTLVPLRLLRNRCHVFEWLHADLELITGLQSINLLLNCIIRLCPLNPRFYGAQTNTSPLKTTAYGYLDTTKISLNLLLLLILFNTPRHSPTSLGVGGLSPP
jgi:hypothetical protein